MCNIQTHRFKASAFVSPPPPSLSPNGSSTVSCAAAGGPSPVAANGVATSGAIDASNPKPLVVCGPSGVGKVGAGVVGRPFENKASR